MAFADAAKPRQSACGSALARQVRERIQPARDQVGSRVCKMVSGQRTRRVCAVILDFLESLRLDKVLDFILSAFHFRF